MKMKKRRMKRKKRRQLVSLTKVYLERSALELIILICELLQEKASAFQSRTDSMPRCVKKMTVMNSHVS
jgi:hypothetical protein